MSRVNNSKGGSLRRNGDQLGECECEHPQEPSNSGEIHSQWANPAWRGITSLLDHKRHYWMDLWINSEWRDWNCFVNTRFVGVSE